MSTAPAGPTTGHLDRVVADPLPPRPGGRRRLVPAVLLAALLALVAGLQLGRGIGASVPAVDDPVSVGFLQDMTTHHAQAVRMSEIVHRRAADPDVRYLAFDILSTQQGQIGIMSGWLDLWDQPASATGPVMTWMGAAHDGPMPGMATSQQIESLDTLPVPQMTEHFLRLMIEHHRGALHMAAYAAEHAGSPEVARLAASMDAGQASEIDLMQDLLAARGWAPEPEDAPTGGTAGHSGSGHDAGGHG